MGYFDRTKADTPLPEPNRVVYRSSKTGQEAFLYVQPGDHAPDILAWDYLGVRQVGRRVKP